MKLLCVFLLNQLSFFICNFSTKILMIQILIDFLYHCQYQVFLFKSQYFFLILITILLHSCNFYFIQFQAQTMQQRLACFYYQLSKSTYHKLQELVFQLFLGNQNLFSFVSFIHLANNGISFFNYFLDNQNLLSLFIAFYDMKISNNSEFEFFFIYPNFYFIILKSNIDSLFYCHFVLNKNHFAFWQSLCDLIPYFIQISSF
ncbi:hypothetical protein ABPG72_009944 [Tetrahymena utriculariae]